MPIACAATPSSISCNASTRPARKRCLRESRRERLWRLLLRNSPNRCWRALGCRRLANRSECDAALLSLLAVVSCFSCTVLCFTFRLALACHTGAHNRHCCSHTRRFQYLIDNEAAGTQTQALVLEKVRDRYHCGHDLCCCGCCRILADCCRLHDRRDNLTQEIDISLQVRVCLLSHHAYLSAGSLCQCRCLHIQLAHSLLFFLSGLPPDTRHSCQ